ncbi:MAG TPA: hypothetical protein VGN86_06380 [Pyrinomonadaceae bacterium]|jgi:hypothetical protein|nr:hypothetical protein [Pyrinomonadaceae bacterium]
MKRELGLLNLICILAALALFGFAVLNAIFSPDFLSIDNLFITAVFSMLALMFIVAPLLQLKSEGKLPMPFKRTAGSQQPMLAATGGAPPGKPLLDAKGRAVPTDVRTMVGRFSPTERKDS